MSQPSNARPTRKLPNILITGTPGTGKTTLCLHLVEAHLPKLSNAFKYHNISDIALKHNLIAEEDKERNTKVIDEDAICDYLENCGMGSFGEHDGGHLVDYHSCDFFAERYFDLIVVLRSATEVLYDRLEKRQYGQQKIRENMDCEIFQVCLDEAINSYPDVDVVDFQNNDLGDLETNCEKVVYCIKRWLEQNNNGGGSS